MKKCENIGYWAAASACTGLTGPHFQDALRDHGVAGVEPGFDDVVRAVLAVDDQHEGTILVLLHGDLRHGHRHRRLRVLNHDSDKLTRQQDFVRIGKHSADAGRAGLRVDGSADEVDLAVVASLSAAECAARRRSPDPLPHRRCIEPISPRRCLTSGMVVSLTAKVM